MRGRDSASKAIIALSATEDISYRKSSALLGMLKSPDELFKRCCDSDVAALIGDAAVKKLAENLADVDLIIDRLAAKGIGWVTTLDDDFPDFLREIQDAPFILYVKGNEALINSDCIAVVGTRRPTRYGLKMANLFAREFAKAGLTVVSGFARGIDRAAHEACTEGGFPTIAVFACGLDICYPAEHRGLYEKILEGGGLLISEYPPGVRPLQYHFPERNRIISGLSEAVFIPEAATKSGSLITARLAVEQGRDLFAIPGNVTSPESEGTNKLLMEMPHALVLSPEDVLRAMNFTLPQSENKEETVELDLAETLVADALREGELHFEELIRKTGLSSNELNIALVNLQLYGIAEDTGGNYYILS